MRHTVPLGLFLAIAAFSLTILGPIWWDSTALQMHHESYVPRCAQVAVANSIPEGNWTPIPKGQLTNVSVNSNGSLVNILDQVSFTINYSKADVLVRVLFSNYPFIAPNIPQPTNNTQVFYFKIQINVTDALAGSVISLRYNRTSLMFTERALWVFQYDDITGGNWTRIDGTNVDLDTGVVTFLMPSVILDNVEFCLTGQITRFGEFPIWGWIILPAIFGIIIFIAVGELVYQGLINVKLKGSDGRVKVRFKQFFAAWGGVFTQLDDKVSGFIEDYQRLPKLQGTTRNTHKNSVSLLRRRTRRLRKDNEVKTNSTIEHPNVLDSAQDEVSQLEDYVPFEPIPRPEIIARTFDRNPFSTAFFVDHEEGNQNHQGTGEAITYVPKAVLAQQMKDQGTPHQESHFSPHKGQTEIITNVTLPVEESPTRAETEKIKKLAPVLLGEESPKLPQTDFITAIETNTSVPAQGAKKARKKDVKKTTKKPSKKSARKAGKKAARKAAKKTVKKPGKKRAKKTSKNAS